jgi:hypothetical protein
MYYNITQQALALSALNQPINIIVPERTSDVSGSHLWPPPNIELKVSLHWWISKCSSTGKKTPAASLKNLQEIKKKKNNISETIYLRTTYITQRFPWEFYTRSSSHKMTWFMKPGA